MSGINLVVPIVGTALSSYKYDSSLSDMAIRKGGVRPLSSMKETSLYCLDIRSFYGH
jgi:hypothetical protein